MKVTIENNEVVIRIAAARVPAPSKSGKTLLVSSTGGFTDAGVQYKGKPMKVAVLATIPTA